MRSMIALMLLTALVTLSFGSALAQDAGNNTTAMNATNETAVAAAVPVAEVAAPVNATEAVVEAAAPVNETAAATEVAAEAAAPTDASRFKQLSVYAGESSVLGKNEAQSFTDVSVSANPTAVFTRDAGKLSPSTKLGISSVGTGDDKYVEVKSQAVGEWDLSGWTLSSAGATTFTFPALTLEEGAVVRVHEGEGAGSATDIYTNSTTPLWTENLISLSDAEGDVISTFDASTQSAASAWVDPLASQIQY
ncbi:MAG: lamin tail domain-containing protein [Methanothrix sp.]|nr:lamin tail domain-containing protein [Methanothrix sp.]